jgi:hypothetical protein
MSDLSQVMGRRQAGKARVFDTRIRRFESFRPSQTAAAAARAEAVVPRRGPQVAPARTPRSWTAAIGAGFTGSMQQGHDRADNVGQRTQAE